MKKNLHLTIHGRVQGVCFRAEVEDRANDLNLTGWIRNNSNGTVEVILEGDEDKLKSILEFCKQGPSSAKVQEILINWGKCKDEFKEFQIRY